MSERVSGEEALIQGYLAPLAQGAPGAFGLRDDCAVVTVPSGCDLVVKTDPVVAGVHFLGDDPPEDIAWKALAVNVSDLVAKGASPMAYLLALALPEAPTDDFMRRLASGLGEAQAAFGCCLVGGDTDRTPGPLTLSVTAMGSVPSGRMVRRGAAQPGDRLLVLGSLGDAALGLRLRREPSLAAVWGLDPTDVAALVGRYLRPRPDVRLAALILKQARAAMDLSDGLVKDLGRMCATSGVGARIDAAVVPLTAALRRAVKAAPELLELVLTGGDDYVPMVAVPPAHVAGLLADLPPDAIAADIGEITAGSTIEIMGPDRRPMRFARSGWDHF
jgi:thiamine-monophosphate kinase